MSSRTITFQTAPHEPLSLREVTAGYPRAVFPDAPTVSGAVLGAIASTVTGAASESYLKPTDTDEVIRVGYASQLGTSRVPGLERAVLVTAPPSGYVNECLVEAEPENRETVEQLLLTWFEPGTTWNVVPMYHAEAFNSDSGVTGIVRVLSPSVAAVAVMMFAIVQWTRRADYALYRLLGVGRAQLLGMITLEWCATLVTASATGTVFGLTVTSHHDLVADIRPMLWMNLLQYFSMLLIAPPLALAAATRMSTVNTLKGG